MPEIHPTSAMPVRTPRPPVRTGRSRARWVLLLPLVVALLSVGPALPSHASGEDWSVTSIKATGCQEFAWKLGVNRAGFDGGYYTWHVQVISDGKTYMNEGFVEASFNGDTDWTLYSTFSYDAVQEPGAFPIPAGKPMKVVLTAERPIGTPVSSWTLVVASCDSATVLYNGPTAADLDEDNLAHPADACPTLRSFRANGCPLRERTLTLRARYGPKRVTGRLDAVGHPSLDAGRTVTIWKARPGPDVKVTTRTTDPEGRFKARVRKGRYYAVAAGLVVPTAGQVTAIRSTTLRVR